MSESLPPSLAKLPVDILQVARAMALWWTFRARMAVYDLLRALGAQTSAGRPFTQEQVRVALQALRRADLLVDESRQPGYHRLADEVRNVLYRELLDHVPVEHLRAALRESIGFFRGRGTDAWPVWDTPAMIALVRLEIYGSGDARRIQEIQRSVANALDWSGLVEKACLDGFDAGLFQRVPAAWRWVIAQYAIVEACEQWRGVAWPLCRWAIEQFERAPKDVPADARSKLGMLFVMRGEADRASAVIAGETGGLAAGVRAAMLVQQGRWAEAQAAFEAALKLRQAESGARKHLLPVSIAWLYPLALLAQQSPRHLELARKFCLGEAGSRKPSPLSAWGVWAHVVAARLGDAPLQPAAFELALPWHGPNLADLWRCLLHAWSGTRALPPRMVAPGAPPREGSVAALRAHLRASGFAWLESQLAAAEDVIAGRAAPEGFFTAGAQESWRVVLASLQALGGEAKQASSAAAAAATRILWWVQLNERGGVTDIVPMEQKRGVRGWGRPKAIPLSRVAANEKLEPWDAKVAQAIRRDRYDVRRCTIDRAAAMQALIGHPAVVLADAPETLVDVVEGTPEMEVVRTGDRYELRITPEMRLPSGRARDEDDGDDDEDDEYETVRRPAATDLTVLRDSPQRIRVIRFTPAQRRAAQLVSNRLSVPASAQAELDQALRALAGHFQIHSDHAQAARQVAAESRLHAELAPAGDGLSLRLVAAPLGPDGPRLRPGSGRTRVMAAVSGETVGAERDLAAERAHLDAVLAAIEHLEPPPSDEAPCEWVVAEPDQALAMVETLPRLGAVLSVDWPRGKPVRVVTVDPARLALTVRSERNWLALQGRVQLDEGRVLALEELLAAAARSRFVPLGKGAYAALTNDLRARLAELASVADVAGAEVRVPELAAGWLDDVLEGVAADRDRHFEEKLARLRSAAESTPNAPGALQAVMRPYQEDGYVWALRLAQAGFGACLADDMGLGKTVQALAVLLARAEGGPALVVAPTSVCGNWLAETQRFAPTLNAVIYGEGDRAATVESAGPHDVVIVSYTLMQQAQETFAARTWHTLVADEAQAIKNAAAKRSLALFDLAADFRLALSGTPIENRLAELWSIMRFCNPGLLGTITRFNERFAGPIERSRDRDAQRILRRLISPFVLRRTKAQVLQELPPRTELILTISPEPDEAAHYEALRRTAIAQAEAAAAADKAGRAHLHILAQITRLRRAACDPRLTSPNLGIVGAKVRAFAELAAELAANRHKALVFSQFVDFLALLRAPLDEAGIRYQYLDGATPAAERTRRVAAFQAGEGDLFLISLKAGGFGLNLTAADYVVITDPWWNPAAEDQAMGRAHRIGQVRPVTVYRLVAKGTLEERIVELHHDKRALAEGVLAGGEEAGALPSNDELIALMRAG